MYKLLQRKTLSYSWRLNRLSSCGRTPWCFGRRRAKYHLWCPVSHACSPSGFASKSKDKLTSRTESQHLGKEALVQGRETLFPHDRGDGRPSPVVLGYWSGYPRRVLDSRL